MIIFATGGAIRAAGFLHKEKPMHLTSPNPDLDQLVRQTPSGSMMFWSGTCGDPVATCGSCRHFHTSQHRKKYNAGYCTLFCKHTGRWGKPFSGSTPACKYFEASQP